MKINQFSIQPTTTTQRQKELQELHLLKAGEVKALTPKALLKTLLTRTH